MTRSARAPAAVLLLCALGLVLGACTASPGGAPLTAAPGAANSGLPSLGVDTNLTGLAAAERRAALARLARMGVSWIRIAPVWYLVQPDPGSMRSSRLDEFDQIIDDAASAGIQVLLIGDQAPDWAGGGGATASNAAAYGAFMGILAEHFRGKGPHGTSPAYEIMNEPNGPNDARDDRLTWATPSEYAHAACAAFHEIKSRDPAATVVAGSLDVSDWEEWLRAAFRAGLGGCFDALSAHPYSGLSVLDRIRAVSAEDGSPDVPIWVTEFGFSTCDNPLEGCVSEDAQASKLVERLTTLRTSYRWVPVAIIYEEFDGPEKARESWQATFGIFKRTSNGQVVEKPAVAAIRALYGGGGR